MKSPLVASAAALLCITTPVLAHPLAAPASFAGGLAHPLQGLDHLLALVALGLLAARGPAPARMWLPLTFLLALLAGSALAALGVPLTVAETGIAASLLLLGLLAGWGTPRALALALPLIALGALCHGHAHYAGTGAGSPVAQLAGLVSMTALVPAMLCAALRTFTDEAGAGTAARALGATIAAAGVVLLAA